MNVLITGSCGFIGYFVSLEFLRNSHIVFGVDNFNAYYMPSLKKFRFSKLKNFENYKHFSLDLSSKKSMRILFDYLKSQRIDLVVHLAAYPGVKYSLQNPYKYIKNNIIATQNLFEMIRNAENFEKRVVLASTSSVYSGNPLPYREDLKIAEFRSPYAYTKFACENIAKFYHTVYGFSFVVLRYFTVYGPYNRPDMAVYKFFESIIKNRPIYIRGKEIKRDFTYVEDVSKATYNSVKLFDANRIFEIINIGSDNPVKVTYLVEMMFKLVSKETKVIIGEYAYFEPRETWADITKARKLIGFEPSTNIHENLQKTYCSLLEFWQSGQFKERRGE
ncbi:MAG: GDP-mannose 4,6-dehydratase [Candidatus Calescibacterium sp.]|nr:GDP-mannose 4,6-dehydratase [Candidatus Calescibacterium sp.]MCX7971604.1 GDP-mannose 4,6-dehydratase [bacterium]MDW8195812.1 GDP-mannose 4,6-dehydratase [Candidatus Calescibacterium sp.]